MENINSNDCYWYVDEDRILALCVSCAQQLNKGWFWKGSELGYGNYNLQCNNYGSLIHKNEEI
jgi:hypothetical protein